MGQFLYIQSYNMGSFLFLPSYLLKYKNLVILVWTGESWISYKIVPHEKINFREQFCL